MVILVMYMELLSLTCYADIYQDHVVLRDFNKCKMQRVKCYVILIYALLCFGIT